MLRKMFVQEAFRGKNYGVAQKLLDSVETKISASGLNKIYLGTTAFFILTIILIFFVFIG